MKEMLERIEEALHRHRRIYFEFNYIANYLKVGIEVDDILQPLVFRISSKQIAASMLAAGIIEKTTTHDHFVIIDGIGKKTWWTFSDAADKEGLIRYCIREQLTAAGAALDNPMAHIHTFWESDLTTQQALLWALKDEPTAPAFIRTIHTIIKEKNHTMFWKREHLHLAYFVRDNPCILNCVKPKCCTHEV